MFAPHAITNPACAKSSRRRPQLDPIHALQRRPTRRRADRPVQLRRSQPMKEPPVHRPIPQLPDRPRIAVRQHALRPKLRRNRRQPRRNSAPAPHPTRSARNASASRPCLHRPLRHARPPPHRIQQPLRRVHPVQILRHLPAQKSPRHRMRRIALHLHRALRSRLRAVAIVTSTPHESGQSCEHTACTTRVATARGTALASECPGVCVMGKF